MTDPTTLRIGGRPFLVTVSRDDLGNYTVDAARAREGAVRSLPLVRVVDPNRDRALQALVQMLEALVAARA